MNEQQGKPDTRGTIRDWPAVMLGICVVVWGAIVTSGQKPTLVMWGLIGFAIVAWLIRSGRFSPRQ